MKMSPSKWWMIMTVAGTAFTSLGAADVPVLGIYVVSSEARAGWRRFDSGSFPNLGYIADQADLQVTRLQDVRVQDTLQRSTTVLSDGSSESTEEWQPTLVIVLFQDDAVALGRLTSAHLGKRMLFLLGSEPLFAPMVRMKIDEPTMSIPLPKGTDAEKVKADLHKLCSEKR